jgi:iron complex transport system substrate-binding protein
MKNLYLITLLAISTFFSCTNKSAKTVNVKCDDSAKIVYAQGFAIKYYKSYKEVLVYSPWIKGAVYARYFLVNDNKTETPNDGIKIKIPLQTLVSTSVTHFEFLSLLHEIETINGVCSPQLIFNETIRKRVGEGLISDLGDAFNINVEKTIQLKPQAVMMSGYNQNDPYAERVTQAGIPVLFNNEWMEKSLLARAEWIKYVAVFYDKEKEADSIFSEIEKRYNQIRDKAKALKYKPTIMAGSNFRGTWYMPAGRSFMGKLFTDAGASYLYANDTTSGSLPLNVETVLSKFAKADIWLNCSSKSLAELVQSDSKNALFDAYKQEQVYNFSKRLLPSTANDFWESAVARPDLLLSDVIAILHPEILPGYELVYAEKLK